jgi:hypothetical protein
VRKTPEKEPIINQEFEKSQEVDKRQEFEKTQEIDKRQEFDKSQEFEKTQKIDKIQDPEKSQEVDKKQEFEKRQEVDKRQEIDKGQEFEKSQKFDKRHEFEKRQESEKRQKIDKIQDPEKSQEIDKSQHPEKTDEINKSQELQLNQAFLKQVFEKKESLQTNQNVQTKSKLSSLLNNYTSFNGTNFGIFLKGLHVNKILENFKQNKYDNFDIIQFKKDIRKKYPLPDLYQTKLIERKELTSFIISEKDNSKHKFFVLEDYPEICNWCREKITSNPLGIPLYLDFIQGTYIIFFENTFYCCFECCYSGIKSLSFDETYSNSEYILKFLFYLTTGNHNLREAPDWRILKKNNDISRTFFKKIGYIETKILSPVFSIRQETNL